MGFFKGIALKSDNYLISNYSIHGINLRLNTNNDYIRSSIDELLTPFNSKKRALFPDINFTLHDHKDNSATNFSLPANSKLLYTPSKNDRFDIKLFEIQTFDLYICAKDSTYYLDLGHIGFLSYDLVNGTSSGYLNNPESISSKVLSSSIFLFIFDQLAKSKGYFPIHCSAVEKDGKGILIPGFSGTGKTTSCISLIRNGYGFLADDRPILHYRMDGKLELLSFPEDINVTEKTLGFFPELAASKFIKDNQGLSKKSFSAKDIYPGTITERCCPSAILYPERHPGRNSSLETLPKSDALSQFLPHSMLVFDKETSKKHFDILVDLITSVDTYRLKLGTDIHAMPDLVKSIL